MLNLLCVCFSGERYLSDGAADRHESLHGSRAASRMCLLTVLAAISLGVSKCGSKWYFWTICLRRIVVALCREIHSCVAVHAWVDLVDGGRDGRTVDVRRRRARRSAVIDRYFVIHHMRSTLPLILIVLSRLYKQRRNCCPWKVEGCWV